MISRQLNTDIGPSFLEISNVSLTDAFHSAASSIGGTEIDRLSSGQFTKGLMLQANLRDYTVDIPELGGMITPRLWMKNVNDGGHALQVGVGFFRFICMNGIYIGVSMFGSKLIHRAGPKAESILDRLPGALNAAMVDIASGAATDILLDATEHAVIDPIDVIGSLDIGLKAKHRAIYVVAGQRNRPEDNPNTVWGLYNIVNESNRKTGKSAFRTASNDMGLLETIGFLADSQVKAA